MYSKYGLSIRSYHIPKFTRIFFVCCTFYAATSLHVLSQNAVTAKSFEDFEIPIHVGDLVSITIEEDRDANYHGDVDASGYVHIPFFGETKIVGYTESQCAAILKQRLEKGLYQTVTVAVRVVKRAPGVAYLYGAVKNPGPVKLPGLGHMTVLQAISYVKGITAWASPDKCTVTRYNPGTGIREKIPVDLIAAFREIGGPDDVKLIADDVVFVPSANAEISQVLSNEPYEIIVVGQVNSPGIINFAPGELRTFMRAMFKAGNFTRFAKKKAVRLIRYGEDDSREVKVVDAGKIIDEGFLEYDFELLPGDMIIVDEKLINF